jgi:hypothetical protein
MSRTHVAILTYKTVGYTGAHYDGFTMNTRALKRQLGVTWSLHPFATINDLEASLRNVQGDIALVSTDWRTPPERLKEILANGRPPRAKVVYLDIFDQSSSPYFSILPEIDLYLKGKVLRPLEQYLEPSPSGFVVSDFCARTIGCDLQNWHFGSTPDPQHLHKVHQGWTFGGSAGLRRLLRLNRLFPARLASRPIDLHARITALAELNRDWYQHYRASAANALEPLRKSLRTTPVNRIPNRKYLFEMRRCKMVFSPFGWGELCQRDFEAVASGCVLIKPDMSHLSTRPNLFIPGETYIPTRWDFADLSEKCRWVLDHPDEARRIARAAQNMFHDYFTKDGFVEDVRCMLNALGLRPATA